MPFTVATFAQPARELSIDLLPERTVADLKAAVEAGLGIPAAHQRLISEARGASFRWQPMHDTDALAEVVQADGRLRVHAHFLPGIVVFCHVVMSGTTMPVTLRSFDSVQALREALRDALQCGDRPMNIIFDRKRLDGCGSLASYGVQDGCVVAVVLVRTRW